MEDETAKWITFVEESEFSLRDVFLNGRQNYKLLVKKTFVGFICLIMFIT